MGAAALNGKAAWTVSSGGDQLITNGQFVGDIACTMDGGKSWSLQSYPERSDYQFLSDVAFEKEY